MAAWWRMAIGKSRDGSNGGSISANHHQWRDINQKADK